MWCFSQQFITLSCSYRQLRFSRFQFRSRFDNTICYNNDTTLCFRLAIYYSVSAVICHTLQLSDVDKQRGPDLKSISLQPYCTVQSKAAITI